LNFTSSFCLVILVSSSENFTAGDSGTQARVRTRLTDLINRGFFCLTAPTNANCTSSNGRRKKRQCSGYNAILINNITEVNRRKQNNKDTSFSFL